MASFGLHNVIIDINNSIHYNVCMITGKLYRTGEDHPAWKGMRNEQLVKDRFPNWPATGTIGMSYPEICSKYQITEGRVHSIIRRMKLEVFGK